MYVGGAGEETSHLSAVVLLNIITVLYIVCVYMVYVGWWHVEVRELHVELVLSFHMCVNSVHGTQVARFVCPMPVPV